MFETNFNKKDIVSTQRISPRSIRAKLKQKERALMRKEAAEDIINQLGWPKKGHSHNIITNGQSNAGGFYEVFRDSTTVDCLCIATWMINRHYIDMLISDIKEQRLSELVFVLSNRMSQLGGLHKSNMNRIKSELPTMSNVSFKIANSHAKVFTMKSKDLYITVSGSGNWSDNPRIENYIICNSEDVFDFHKSWMLEICK